MKSWSLFYKSLWHNDSKYNRAINNECCKEFCKHLVGNSRFFAPTYYNSYEEYFGASNWHFSKEVELPNAYGKSPEFRDIFMRVADVVWADLIGSTISFLVNVQQWKEYIVANRHVLFCFECARFNVRENNCWARSR